MDIGKEGASTAPFPLVAVTLNESGAQAYGRSTYCVGWSFTESTIPATHDNTVLIEFDEAKTLAQAVGKTSAAKDATVWVEITPDGRLVVDYGSENIADMVSVGAGDGDIESIDEELHILDQAGAGDRTHLCLTHEVIKRFTKVRDKTPYMDMVFTGIGNTVFVKIGDGFIGAFEAVDRARVDEPKLWEG